jgi:hypothetical protein
MGEPTRAQAKGFRMRFRNRTAISGERCKAPGSPALNPLAER